MVGGGVVVVPGRVINFDPIRLVGSRRDVSRQLKWQDFIEQCQNDDRVLAGWLAGWLCS